MAKEFLTAPLKAALEKLIREQMPELNSTLHSLQGDVRGLYDEVRRVDAKVDSLRTEMLDRFSTMLETVNEVSHRITRLDGKLEGFSEAMGVRLKMVEVSRQSKRRRAS